MHEVHDGQRRQLRKRRSNLQVVNSKWIQELIPFESKP